MSSLYGIELFFFGGDKNCHQMIFCTHHVAELPPRITTIKISALHTNMQQLQKVNISLFMHMTSILMHIQEEKTKNVFVIYGGSNTNKCAFHQDC